MAVATLETATKELNQQIGLTTDGSQYLTFQLGDELYGVDILRVQEIKGYTTVTKIPNTPPHIKGVLNLRGTIVPIVELRTKFGMPTIDYTMLRSSWSWSCGIGLWALSWIPCRMSSTSTKKTFRLRQSLAPRWT